MKLPTYSTTAKTLKFFVLCVAAYTSSFQVASAQRPSVADRPNVILIYTDDHGYAQSHYGGAPLRI